MARNPALPNEPETLGEAEVLAIGEYGCLGIDSDLFQASRKACRQTIERLVNTKDLSREEACILMSVTGDLKIVEAVDMPNHAVSMSIPLFVGRQFRDEGPTPKS